MNYLRIRAQKYTSSSLKRTSIHRIVQHRDREDTKNLEREKENCVMMWPVYKIKEFSKTNKKIKKLRKWFCLAHGALLMHFVASILIGEEEREVWNIWSFLWGKTPFDFELINKMPFCSYYFIYENSDAEVYKSFFVHL